MVAECPPWLRYCYSGKDWSLAIIITGQCLSLVALIVACTQLILFRKNLHKLLHTRQHYKIFVVTIICSLVRIPWWFLNIVSFENNSPPAIAIQMLNRICMLSLYLMQSFYVQTWLKLIIALSQYRGEKLLRVFFLSLDSVLSLLCVLELIYRAFDKSSKSQLYTIGISMIACCSLLICVIYILVGYILFYKLKNYFRGQYKIFGFVLASFSLSFASISRFVCLFYNKFTNQYLNDDVFALFCYFFPDLVSFLTVGAMQNAFYRNERKQKVKGMTVGLVTGPAHELI
ncbi:Conserved_hypothetical protein [Hexamita inflata]|uniref:Uncharacterized protein n=1 Tax=Hexamita inflata TaxID=28002 RepID=A0AA86V5Z0_9EUKA|nr:Conserved hypothetical protein [Hexamita inflata]